MTYVTNCIICGQPLVYATETRIRKCDFCGHEDNTLIYCAAGHYVCDLCHSKKAIEVARQLLDTTDSKDPVCILEQIMAHHAIPIHGPEHHSIVPGAIIAAVRNAGYRCPMELLMRLYRGQPRCPADGAGLMVPVEQQWESALR